MSLKIGQVAMEVIPKIPPAQFTKMRKNLEKQGRLAGTRAGQTAGKNFSKGFSRFLKVGLGATGVIGIGSTVMGALSGEAIQEEVTTALQQARDLKNLSLTGEGLGLSANAINELVKGATTAGLDTNALLQLISDLIIEVKDPAKLIDVITSNGLQEVTFGEVDRIASGEITTLEAVINALDKLSEMDSATQYSILDQAIGVSATSELLQLDDSLKSLGTSLSEVLALEGGSFNIINSNAELSRLQGVNEYETIQNQQQLLHENSQVVKELLDMQYKQTLANTNANLNNIELLKVTESISNTMEDIGNTFKETSTTGIKILGNIYDVISKSIWGENYANEAQQTVQSTIDEFSTYGTTKTNF